MKKLIIIFVLTIVLQVFSQERREGVPFRETIYLTNIIVPEDTLYNCYFTYKIPYNNLVFVKQNGFYTGGLELMFEAKDDDENFIRESVSEDITISNYDLVESTDNFLEGIVHLKLIEGNYTFIPLLTIQNTKDVFRLRPINIDLSNTSNKFILPPVVVSTYEENCQNNSGYRLINFKNSLPYTSEKYVLLIPVLDTTINELNLSIKEKGTILFSETLTEPIWTNFSISECDNKIIIFNSDTKNKIKLFVSKNFNAPLDEGLVKVEITHDSLKVDFPLRVIWIDKPFSLTKLDFSIEIIEYIETQETIDSIFDLDEEKQYEGLKQVWAKYDPDKSNKFNEVMSEYYYRVDDAMRMFSNGAERNGALTDMGRIFIMYGPPDEKKRSYSDKYNVVEIWKYLKINREFIFSDNVGLGNYKLLEE